MASLTKRLGLVLCLLSFHARADNYCAVPKDVGNSHCEPLKDNAYRWTIREPDVSKFLTEYPYIQFEKGQIVTVSAGGCVNVSKDAKTTHWKDYVDPQGGSVDRHYHGLIWIPGARIMQDGHPLVVPVGTAPVHIGSIAGGTWGDKNVYPEELIIDDPPSGTRSTLRLGYEGAVAHQFNCSIQGTCDTIYPKTPYPASSPQKGQCKSEASVVITIYPHPPDNSNPARALKPFDVVSSQVDDNGFLFSPQWFNTRDSSDITRLAVADECENFHYKNWLFVRRGINSPCTQQSSFDVPKTFTECLLAPGFGELHGHVNWAPATFVGKLDFQEVSPDKDVDLQLKTIGDRLARFPGNKDFGKIAPSLTKDSQISDQYKDALWLEFATYETSNNFAPPWDDIKFSRNPKAFDPLKKQFQDKTAIVTGLLDLDCVHDCHTELHPVFAMAIRQKLEYLGSDIVSDDPWMIFVRDAGNEGDCSLDEHYLDRNGYTFFLPAPPGAALGTPIISNAKDAFRSNEEGLTWSLERSTDKDSNGVRLRISFTPTTDACSRIHHGQMVHVSGLVHLNWTDASPSQASQPCQAPNARDDTASDLNLAQKDNNPVFQIDRACQQRLEMENCTSRLDDKSDGKASDYFERSQVFWSANHRASPPDHSWSTVSSQLVDFLGSDIGLFEELILYNKTSQIQPNFGGRFGIIQTPLGSVEIDGAPGLSRAVKSTNGQNLNVKISDWMVGLKVQFAHQLGMFAEVKGGQIFRSASAGYTSTPDFADFHGHNPIFLAGGGIQPGNNVLAKGTRITLRISVDYIRITGSGENMVRITIGPQFQIHKKRQ